MREHALLALFFGMVACGGKDRDSDEPVLESDITFGAEGLVWTGVPEGSVGTLALTIVNAGRAPAELDFSVDDPAFTVHPPADPLVLDAGERVDVPVDFTSPGHDVHATLTVLVDDQAHLVPLTATSAPFALHWDGDRDLGVVPRDCVAEEIRTLTNTGPSPHTIAELGVEGAGFSVDGPALPLTLDADESVDVTLRFQPGSAGEHTGVLSATTDTGLHAESLQRADSHEESVCVELALGESTSWLLSTTTEVEVLDVALLLDTTGSMAGLLDEWKWDFHLAADLMASEVHSPSWSVSTFDDYNYGDGTMGVVGDLPFRLLQAQTLDPLQAQDALDDTRVNNGADLPESTHEALFQLATGHGYDQDCSGSFDEHTDVLPFVASPADPFAGSAPDAAPMSRLGDAGGTGFRENVLRYAIYVTDAELRDPDIGHAVPDSCPPAAGSVSAAAALDDAGIRLIGVPLIDGVIGQMTTLSEATGSLADLDDDGTPDPLLYEASHDFTLVDGSANLILEDLARFEFAAVWLEADPPPEGGIDIDIATPRTEDVVAGDPVTLSIHLTATSVALGIREIPVRLMAEHNGHDIILRQLTLAVQQP